MKSEVRATLFGGALAVSLVVAVLVYRGGTSHWLAAVWFLSLFPFALAARQPRTKTREQAPLPVRALLLLAVAALPVLVRVANFDSNRMHGDELMTAYFSATHDFGHSTMLSHSDAARPGFFGYIPEKWEWQAQFPKPFFFLQRVFFTLFGESLFAVRLSVQIHVALVSVMLFLIVREILDQTSALIAVVLYSFFAASVYLETLGVMFISSTAALTVFFYFAIREYRTGEMFHAALAGMACGFCYLTYYTSYLAFPLFVIICAAHFLRRRNILVLQNFAIALAGMLLVLAPFLAYGLRYGNYVAARANQLGLLTGEWSPHREEIAKGANPIPIVWDNLVLSLRSFVQDGIGGGGGYDLGHQAFLDRFSLAFLLAGIVAGIVLAFRKTELFFVFLVIGAAFFGFVVLALPPPAYHRFSVAFPFLVILMTLPFSLLVSARRLPRSVRYGLTGGLLLLFACVNERRMVEAVWLDKPVEELRLARYLGNRYPGRSVYVAAYGGFGYGRILYFFMRNPPPRRIETDYHENLLKAFNRNEKYVYLVLFPEEFDEKFRKADPAGRLFQFSKRWSVFAN
jgi:hypothetical protein